MQYTRVVALTVGIVVGTGGLALAQPAYGPNASPYGAYAPPPPTAVQPPPPPYSSATPYSEPHTSGGASRAYSYWGAQKSN